MIGKLLAMRYELVQAAYETSIFTVWSGRDRMTGRDVSIRLLNPPFDQEAPFHDALAGAIKEFTDVKHPGLERLASLEKDEDAVFIVGDAVRGMSLAERIQKLAPFSVPVAVSTAVTICEALATIHRAGHTHGDVGSHNVRVLPEGTAIVEVPGIWKAYGASRTAGSVVLSQMAPYLAPEISKGAMPSPASDVYAVGILLHELLSGKHPFESDSPLAMVTKHVTEPIPSLRDLNPNIPVAVAEVVKKALAKERPDRYPSAVELLSDLRMIQDALRFGRNLTWPVKPPEEASPAEASTESTPSAVKKEQAKKVREEDDYGSDVPGWLKGTLIFFVSLVLMMIGTWIAFNFQKPKLTVVPDIRRKTVSEAETLLKDANLKLRISRRTASESYAQDAIIQTDPAPGTKVYEGNTINAEVSAGSRFVEVPDLRGLSQDEARLLLDSVGLKLDTRVEEKRDPDVKKGTVLEQVPEPRKRVERRTEIKVVVSSGRDRPDRTGSTSSERFLYTLRIELSDITESVMMRVDMTDARGTRTISEQDRLPGEVVELSAEGVGEKAIFLIYYDGELITQETKYAKPPEGAEETQQP